MRQDKHIIGSDEVGKSDYFGPMVICGVSFKEKQNLDIFTSMKDSKKISFSQASDVFHTHKHRFNYSINIIDSKVMFKFLSLKSYNLNHFLYYFHFLTTLSIAKNQIKEGKNNWIVIIDDFTNGSKKNQDRYFAETSKLLTQYIEFPNNYHKKIHFIPKADTIYIENKIASIFAKHFFYEEIKKIAYQIQKYNVKVKPKSLLGNSKETNNLILELVQQMPVAILKPYLKSIYWKRFHL